MGVGYIVLLFILIFIIWLLIDSIKERQRKKKIERELADKGKVQEILAKQQSPQNTAQKTAAINEKKEEQSTNAGQNKERLVDDSGKIKMVD